MHEVAGDEDQRGVVVVRVDVGNRPLKARIRIDTRPIWHSRRPGCVNAGPTGQVKVKQLRKAGELCSARKRTLAAEHEDCNDGGRDASEGSVVIGQELATST
jgi:hypothetical protein